MNRSSDWRSRALAALLLFVLLLAPACGLEMPGGGDDPAARQESAQQEVTRGSPEEIEKAAKGQLGSQEGSQEDTNAASEAPQESTSVESEAPKNVEASENRTPEAPSVHRATAENSRGDYTYLSDLGVDGDPNALVFASPGGSYEHNIGVWYEPEEQKWAIFNQDRAAVPAGSTFEVVVPQDAETFLHKTTAENISAEGTYLDDPLVNGKPDAEVSVTQNWNPGGGNGVYNDHPVDVRYDGERERWEVYNSDGAGMPEGAAFNVTVSEQASTSGGGDVASIDTGEAPEYRNFFKVEGNPQTPEQFVSSDSSTGAIPIVKPFNFGRDPGGPEDKTLSLDIPKIGLQGIPVYDTLSEEKLRDGTVHIPATGYPWQDGANVFIAGHRIGFEGTPSYYVFYRLNELVEGDEIRLQDAAGREYLYRVTERKVVGPDNVEVMNAEEGRSLITLQTCTLPDYKDRVIVQGELVQEPA